jgi:hypothetical protein
MKLEDLHFDSLKEKDENISYEFNLIIMKHLILVVIVWALVLIIIKPFDLFHNMILCIELTGLYIGYRIYCLILKFFLNLDK